MLLVKVLNEELKKVPNISKKLQIEVKAQKWDGKRKLQAIELLRQLEKPTLCTSNVDETIAKVYFEPLYLMLTPSEYCSISWSMNEVMKYVEELITDINQFSSDVLLVYGGHEYTVEDICKIKIDWYI